MLPPYNLCHFSLDRSGPVVADVLHALNPDPLKDPKVDPLPDMNPLLHWRYSGMSKGFLLLDPLGGLGRIR